MKLLTKEIKNKIPKLYDQAEKGDEAICYVKFFCPWNNWKWFATEFDGKNTFFGLVHGFEKELGYFTLEELENLKGPFGLKIERDLHFRPMKLKDIKES